MFRAGLDIRPGIERGKVRFEGVEASLKLMCAEGLKEAMTNLLGCDCRHPGNQPSLQSDKYFLWMSVVDIIDKV